MKKKYFSKTLKMILFLTLIFTSLRSFSQTVLTEGDIAFTRINIDDESFSFVLLVPITNSTQFIITDEAWDGSTLLAFESSIQFTATSTFLAGEEISISSTSLSASSSGSGTATLTSIGTINPTGGNMLGAAGDNLFIYQSAGAPGSNDFVTGINANGGVIGSPGNAWSTSTSNSNSLLPSGLTNGTNALGIFPNGGAQTEVDNARYKATALRSGDKATILAAIMDLTNWEYDNDFVQAPVGTSFTITGGNTAPVIAGTSAGQAVNDNSTLTPFSAITTTDADGDNLTATITLDNNAKGVLSGAGLTGTGPYTIASTTPADLQAKLRGLSYNPTDNRTATTETTTFTVVINDGVDTDTDATTTVISSAVAPTVTSVTVPANATYTVSQNLDFTVNFDENVTVNTAGGTPQINLTIGATSRQATYQSGSGTAALLFRYTIQNSELDTDGIAVGTLAANGGILRDSGSADANLTLNSIGSTTAVLVDAVAPTITSVTVPANATYIAGQNLDFTINTNENITVNTAGGTPQLSLTIGATTRQAVYQSGSGTSALLFRYTVQAGELDTDGIAVGTLAANGGTLADAAGNNLNTTLNSVGSTTVVLVDAVAPTITSVTVPANATYIAGQNLDFTINTNENTTVNTTGGTPQLSLTIGATTRQAVYQSGSGTSALLFRYTVQAGDLDTDGIAVGTLATNGGTLRDAVGNNLNTTLNSVGSTTAVLVDAAPPTITSVTVPANATYIAGQNLDFTINTSENVTVNTAGGTPQLSITIGATTRQAVYQSGSGTSALLFRYTVQAGEQDTDGIAVGTLSANGGTLRDAVGNNLNTTLNSVGSTTAVLVDAAPPTITSVTVPANATYIAGQNLDFTINTSENVTVNTAGGTPQLSITIGATTRQAVYQSGSGTSALLFRYTVQAGELDTDGIAVGTLATNGGTLRDAVNNNLNTTLNSVGSTTAVLVDAVAPTITSVTVPANATYIAGQNLDFTINTNENVTVNTAGGTPQLSLTIGATTRQAVYQSGSGTSALLFRYTIQAGELDTDGIAVGTLAANGGTLRDAAGNNLNTTLNSVGSTTAVLVDAVAPTITSVTVPANATYIAGQNLDFTINTNENVTVNTTGGTPQLSITIGATTRQAAYISGSGTLALLFRYTVQAGDLDTDGIAVGTLATNGGTLTDAAGNNLNTTLNSVGSTTAVLVDANRPTIVSVAAPLDETYTAGQDLFFIIRFNEEITVNTSGGTPQLAITIGTTTRQAVYSGKSGAFSLLFIYVVQTGDLDTDGITIGTINANGGTIRDTTNNDANLTLNNVSDTTAVLVDAVAPTVTSVAVPLDETYTAGQDLFFIIRFNEEITVNTSGGTPQLAITIGTTTRQVVYSGKSGAFSLLFLYVVQTGDLDTDGITIGALDTNGGTIRDTANNDANLTLNNVSDATAVLVDAVAPTVTSVTVPANSTYTTGQNLDFTVNFNENITVNTIGGTPQIAITIGATTRQATYQSGSGNSAIVFRYTVQAGEVDTDGIAVGTLATNGGTLRDNAGNDANVTLNTVGATTAVLVDAVAPTITSVTVPTNATYITGQNLDFTINTSKNVIVSTAGGTPQMAITIGATTRQATYQSGSGTSALLFRYTVQTGELDTDGIAVGTLSANSGTLRDIAGNDLNTTLNSVGVTTAVLVDAVPPTGYTVTIDQSPINAINHNAVSFTFAGAEIGTTYNYTFNTSGGSGTVTGSGTIVSATDQITGIDLSGLSDGTITLGVTLTDPIGNTGAETLDTKNKKAIPPTATIIISDDTLTIGETAVVTITFSEAVTGFDNTDLTIPNGSLSTLTSTDGNITFTATFTPTVDIEDNTNTIILDNTGIADSVGNVGTGTTDSTNFSIDLIIPTAIVEISDTELTTGETATVTITFSEAVTGFDNTDLTIPNGTLTAVSSEDGNITFTAIFTPTEGIQSDTNMISLDNTEFTDVAGNEGTGNTDSINFSIDTLTPTPVTSPLTFNKGFSPNGDGINDTWIIEGIEDFPNHTLQVFNRSGRKIFEAKDYQNNWDGVSSGNSVFGNDKLPVGAYYYVLETGSNEVPPLTGWIYINY